MSLGDEPTQAPGFGASDATFEVGAMVGEYRIEGELGSGGMGHVYAAVHPVIAKRAAIKVLRAECSRDASAIERFVFEARAVNEIQHPNIVDIFAFGVLPDGRHYFVMEWLRGLTLRQRTEGTPLSHAEACEVLLAIANALAAAHAVGIVHRDLKPDNVFLVEVRDNPRPLVKLLDFGIAKLLLEDHRINQTATGVFMGTPAYTSPEQARGEGVDHRTDLYALGVIAFELLTGRLPFEGRSTAEVLVKHLTEPVPAVTALAPGAPAELAALVEALLAKDPAVRPTIDDVRGRLRGLADAPAILPGRPQRSRAVLPTTLAPAAPSAAHLRPAPPVKHHRGAAAAVAIGAAALVLATIFIAARLTGGHHDSPAAREAASAPVPAAAAVVAPVPAASAPVVPSPADAAMPDPTQAAGDAAEVPPHTDDVTASPHPTATPKPKPPVRTRRVKRGKKPPSKPDRDGLL